MLWHRDAVVLLYVSATMLFQELQNGLNRHTKTALIAEQLRKSKPCVKAPRFAVLRINNDSECRNVRARGPLYRIGDEGRAEVAALIGCRDRQSPQEDGRDERMAGQALRLRLRQVCEQKAGRRNRVVTCNGSRRLLNHDEQEAIRRRMSWVACC